MGLKEQPAAIAAPSSKQKEKEATISTSSSKKKRKLPSPRELIAHYESQGMDTQEASLKLIEDLQNVLFRVVTSSSSSSARRYNNNINVERRNFMAETSRKLDVLNSRLLKLDAKLDSKPGYPQTLALGLASGAILRGLGTGFPLLAGAFTHIWKAVAHATSAAATANN